MVESIIKGRHAAGIASACREPLAGSGAKAEPVSEAVGDGEATQALELHWYNHQLPLKIWSRIIVEELQTLAELQPAYLKGAWQSAGRREQRQGEARGWRCCCWSGPSH